VAAQSQLQALLIGGVSIGSLLMFSLLVRKNNPKANRILAGVLFCQLHLLVLSYLQATGHIEFYPGLLRSPFPTSALCAALLYFYTCFLTVPGFRFVAGHLAHLIPFAIGLVWYVARLIPPYETPVVSPAFLLERQGGLLVILILYLVYYVACFKKVRSYQANLRDYFSETSRVRLNWLFLLFGGSSLMWLIGCLDFMLGPQTTLWHIFVPALAAQTFVMALFSLRQSVIFSPNVDWEPPESPSKTSLFSSESLKAWRTKLATYMAEAKPHLNPALRLSDLAAGLKLKPYQLSEILNKGEGTHFYDYVNRHRVEDAQRLLIDGRFDHMSILGIAEEAGFNSKSVFNEAFKKQTGVTPSTFRDQKKANG
jgi:AraC-like DNA-binding protein